VEADGCHRGWRPSRGIDRGVRGLEPLRASPIGAAPARATGAAAGREGAGERAPDIERSRRRDVPGAAGRAGHAGRGAVSGGEDETAVGTPTQGRAPGAGAPARGPGERRARAAGFVERLGRRRSGRRHRLAAEPLLRPRRARSWHVTCVRRRRHRASAAWTDAFGLDTTPGSSSQVRNG